MLLRVCLYLLCSSTVNAIRAHIFVLFGPAAVIHTVAGGYGSARPVVLVRQESPDAAMAGGSPSMDKASQSCNLLLLTAVESLHRMQLE